MPVSSPMPPGSPIRATLRRPTPEVGPAVLHVLGAVTSADHSMPDEAWLPALTHDDELVVWSALSSRGPARNISVSASLPARVRATRELLDRAIAAGEVWNPVLDRLAELESFWPADGLAVGAAISKTSDVSPVALPSHTAYAASIAPIVRDVAARDPRAIAGMLAVSRARVFVDAALESLSVITDDIVEAATLTPVALERIAARPDLSETQRLRLATAAIDRFTLGGARHLAFGRGNPSAAADTLFVQMTALIMGGGALPAAIRDQLAAVQFPAERRAEGYRPPDVSVAELVQALDPGTDPATLETLSELPNRSAGTYPWHDDLLRFLVVNPALPEPARKRIGIHLSRIHKGWEHVLTQPCITSDVLLRLVELVGGTPTILVACIEHPNASVAVLKACAARRFDASQIQDALAQHPLARQDPELRRLLLRCRSPRVAYRLIPHATPEEFEPLWFRLAKGDPDYAWRLLHERRIPAGVTLHRRLLTPIMQQPGTDQFKYRLLELFDTLQEEVADAATLDAPGASGAPPVAGTDPAATTPIRVRAPRT